MKAINIKWDVDCDEDSKLLPTEIEIPSEMEDEDEISDYLSDVTGYCHKGFTLIGKKLDYEKATHGGYGCAICGHPIQKGEEYLDCPDCAAIFCKNCCEDGTFDNHSCEELEEEFADDWESC